MSTGAWLGFTETNKAEIVLDDETGEHRDSLVRFQTEEDAKIFLTERVLTGDNWVDVIQDLTPKQLDKSLW